MVTTGSDSCLGILGKPEVFASLSSDLQHGRFLARIGRHKYYVANEIVAKCQAGLGPQNYFKEPISVNGCDCVFVESGRAASDRIVDINAESRAGREVRSPLTRISLASALKSASVAM